MQEQVLPAMQKQFGGESLEFVEALCIGGRIRLEGGDATRALADADQALAVYDRMQLAATSNEIACRSLRAQALLALSRSSDARTEADRALQRLRLTSPGAHVKQTQLLVLRARSERASGDASAAAATLDEARRLHADAALLSTEDRTALGLPAQS